MTNPNSPLTDQHLAQIKQGLIAIQNAESQILLAKQAGLDVSSAEAQLSDSKAKLQRIKAVYFPNG